MLITYKEHTSNELNLFLLEIKKLNWLPYNQWPTLHCGVFWNQTGYLAQKLNDDAEI